MQATSSQTNALPASSLSFLDRASRRWWFYLILLVLFFLPAYAQRPYDPRNTPQLVIEVLSHPAAYAVPALFPLFKLAPAALIVLLWVLDPRVDRKVYTRIFYGYAAANLLIIAVFQNIARTPNYGLAVLVGNVVIYGLIGLLWAWEAAKGTHPLFFNPRPRWRYWVVPLALLAFWFPVNTAGATPTPDFSPFGLVMNEAGFTFCMMLPVYLGALTMAVPNVNPTLLRVTAFVGLVTGLLNVFEFFANASYGWWMGIVHLPLLLISAYALWMGRK